MKKEKRKEREIAWKLEASYTVEAAFIFPVLIFVSIGLCYMVLFLHDDFMVEKTVQEELLVACIAHEQDETIRTTEMQSQVKQLLINRLWASDVSRAKVTRKTNFDQLEVSINRRISIPFLSNCIGKMFSTKVEKDMVHPCTVVRTCRLLSEMAEVIQGEEKEKDEERVEN